MKKTEIQKTGAQQDAPPIDALQAFQRLLDAPVYEHDLKLNKVTGKKYMPIEIVEKKLDAIYSGLWQVVNVNYNQMLNSVTCSVELQVFHPVLRVWVTRAGLAAWPIQLKKGEKEITPWTINTMALQMNLPAARALAIHNAAKGLGRTFGRDFGRDDVLAGEVITDTLDAHVQMEELRIETFTALAESQWAGNPALARKIKHAQTLAELNAMMLKLKPADNETVNN
jgi:hypothetical protein